MKRLCDPQRSKWTSSGPAMLRLLIVSAIIAAAASNLNEQNPKCETDVDITVYFESKCNASELFILEQLSPIAHKLFNWLHIELIPYGLATLNERGEAMCTHGPNECLMNRILACALKRMNTREGPRNDLAKVELSLCMLSDFTDDAFHIAKKCAMLHQLSWSSIKTCATGSEGLALERKYIEQTKQIGVPYAPFIAFNKEFGNNEYQKLAMSDLITLAQEVHDCNPPPKNVTCTNPVNPPPPPPPPIVPCGPCGASPSPCCELLAKGYQYEDLHIIRLVPPADNRVKF